MCILKTFLLATLTTVDVKTERVHCNKNNDDDDDNNNNNNKGVKKAYVGYFKQYFVTQGSLHVFSLLVQETRM
jgi:hypothetical protein